MISEIISAIKHRQAEIRVALVDTPVSSHEIYNRIVGEYQGLQWVLDVVNIKLEEKE